METSNKLFKGKVVGCYPFTNYFFCGYELYQTIGDADAFTYSFCASIKDRFAKYSTHSITRRFLRAEVTSFYVLHDNSMLAVAKKGIFRRPSGDVNFYKVFAIPRGSRPLNICILPNGHMFFGEYFQNMSKEAVHIYGSVDNGLTWDVVYTFDAGNINHVHGLFFDKFVNRLWVLTGDRKDECIIGYTDNEFKSFHEFLRGGQDYRSCQLFFYRDFIVYATDSQYRENEIRAINRETLDIITLAKIQGSAIKGGQTGDVAYISTAVEPSDVNLDKFSHIWVTKDGLHWEDKFKAEKDCWPSIFQYATFEFPYNACCNGKLWFTGRSIKKYDGKAMWININE